MRAGTKGFLSCAFQVTLSSSLLVGNHPSSDSGRGIFQVHSGIRIIEHLAGHQNRLTELPSWGAEKCLSSGTLDVSPGTHGSNSLLAPGLLERMYRLEMLSLDLFLAKGMMNLKIFNNMSVP